MCATTGGEPGTRVQLWSHDSDILSSLQVNDASCVYQDLSEVIMIEPGVSKPR